MKNLLFLGLAATACSFSPPETTSSSNKVYSSKSETHELNLEKKVSEQSLPKLAEVIRDDTYRNYFKCQQTEFAYKYCFLETSKIIDSSKDDLSFDYMVSYRFTCEKTRSSADLKLGLTQNAKSKRFEFGNDQWTSLGVFSSETDLVTFDTNSAKTRSTIIPKSSDCSLNIKSKKLLSKVMIENTREKMGWVKDLYSFYKPLISSKAPLSETQKDNLKSTLYKMEKTLEDVIKEVKIAFLYDSKHVFKASDRNLIYKISKKIK